jgi:predicted nucleic-acid-binding protein
MIGVDTNVLLRAFADEDDPHTARARQLLTRLEADGEVAWVNHVVLCEFAWVLERSKRFSRSELADLIATIASTRLLTIADRDAVEQAVQLYKDSRADFADALIGVLNRRAGCATTYTFDRRAAATADFSAVG